MKQPAATAPVDEKKSEEAPKPKATIEQRIIDLESIVKAQGERIAELEKELGKR
jgi:hypothetical protein